MQLEETIDMQLTHMVKLTPDAARGFCILPYIKGTTEPISSEFLAVTTSKLLKNHTRPSGICFLNRKFQHRKITETRGAIYSIPCKDCDESYIGKTKRKFSTRLKEHQKAVEHEHSQKSALAKHCLRSGHTVSWEASKILRTSANWGNRRVLEAWEINTCRNPLNRDDGMHLPQEFLNLVLREKI